MNDTRQVEPSTYENRLRIIGRHLDRGRYRGLSLFETSDGIIVRAFSGNEREPEALQFRDNDIPTMLAAAKAARGEGSLKKPVASKLIPTGYEDFLRALGSRFDEDFVDAIVITEFMTAIGIAGLHRAEYSGNYGYVHFEMMLGARDIEELLNIAFKKRGVRASPDNRKSWLRS